jgi:hypothetical protein
VRYPDSTEEKEWLIVKKGDDDEKVTTYTLELYVDTTKEITVLELNDDLRAWMNAHEDQIKVGDVDTFREYSHQKRLT